MNKYKDFMSKLLELVLPTDIVRYCIQPFLLPSIHHVHNAHLAALKELYYNWNKFSCYSDCWGNIVHRSSALQLSFGPPYTLICCSNSDCKQLRANLLT